MGSEVSKEHFSQQDFRDFQKRLVLETECLLEKLYANQFSNHAPVAGFEIEGCLVNSVFQPAPVNQEFIKRFDHQLITPELAKFNIELNTTPQPLEKGAFRTFEKEISELVTSANDTAHELDAKVLLTGVLPTLRNEHFCLQNMSEMNRYHALNEEILKARNYEPLHLKIAGKESIKMDHNSVMMEAATTSIQLHLQVPISQAHFYYNASIMASAAVMAVSGNASYFFGKQLWHETRIPLFEQAICFNHSPQRVSFGTGYVHHIADCFKENLSDYPVLLPMLLDEPIEAFANLSLHNGVIWRWNRPLVGFDEDGSPHIRIEHRVMPAGPTVTDMVTNAAFYYGLTEYFAKALQNGESLLPFQQAEANFYAAAKSGLEAELTWKDKTFSAKTLVLSEFLANAKTGLEQLNIDTASIDYYLDIMEKRVQKGQTGAVWQIEHVRQKACSMAKLTEDYAALQKEGNPVHTWQH